MRRCIQIAGLAAGRVAPNPMVGAVLVHNDRIIGEGYHECYGGPHAEVNCIGSVRGADQGLIENATLYVCLEPCVHFGKTPPCADLIIEKRIKKVVVGCRDPFVEVNGKGIEKLQAAGIEVMKDIYEDQCKDLNKRFFTFHKKHRPYIILKWAQTQNAKIATTPALPVRPANGINPEAKNRLLISNEYTNRMVHKWRSEEASILVGTNTALLDDPELTTRSWAGPSPIRFVVDMDLKLPATLKMFNDNKSFTVILNTRQHQLEAISLAGMKGIGFYQVTNSVNLVHQVLHAMYQLKVQSVMVEGGARLLQSFIDEQVWDEARIITNSKLHVTEGISSPTLSGHNLVAEDVIGSDQIQYFVNTLE